MVHRRKSRWTAALPLFALASCVAPPRAAPPPVRPQPPAPPIAAPPLSDDWRDWPLTPGRWTWGASPAGQARFGAAGSAPLFELRCDPVARAVRLVRPAPDAPARSMAITTTDGSRALATSAGAVAQATLAAGDPFLDRMAFSRGRIVVAVTGTPRLVLPAWAEIGRVVEDCRG